MINACKRLAAALFAVVVCVSSRPANAVQIEQMFPAAPAGTTASDPESGWRIVYDVLEPGTHSYGRSGVLQFSSVEFMRGKTSQGRPDWLRILNNLAMAEMYVPYNDGTYILDIKGRSHYGLPILSGFSFVRAQPEFLPKFGAISARILPDGFVVAEVVDDGVRFMDGRRGDVIRRGQTLWLWTTLSAANYRYILRYGFVDDGTIMIRVGGTAENLYDDAAQPGNKPVHVHMAAWRMEFDLGNSSQNMVAIVERKPETSGGATMVHRAFNNGVEGGEKWVAENFTALKVMNMVTLNQHVPPRNVGYKLMPYRTGTLRTEQRFTEYDFWVTRRLPSREKRKARSPELTFVDVPDNVSIPEPINHQSTVIWYTAGANHMPRTEDFGREGFRRRDGVAIAMWAGFDMMPHDLWGKTPFLNR